MRRKERHRMSRGVRNKALRDSLKLALTESHYFARAPHAIEIEQQKLVEWAWWPFLVVINTNDGPEIYVHTFRRPEAAASIVRIKTLPNHRTKKSRSAFSPIEPCNPKIHQPTSQLRAVASPPRISLLGSRFIIRPVLLLDSLPNVQIC